MKTDVNILSPKSTLGPIWGELEREEYQSLLQATIESTADGILIVDKNGKISTFNKKFAQLWKLPDHIMATHDDDQALEYVLHQLKEPDVFLKKVRELYNDPSAESFDVLEFIDGRVFERFSRPQFVSGESVGRVWSFRDMSDYYQVKAELEKAILARDEFISIASHELRTPLSSLNMHIQLMKKSSLDLKLNNIDEAVQKLTKTADNAERQIHRISTLIDNLLDVSRIGAKQLVLNPKNCDLSSLVKDAVSQYSAVLEDKTCDVKLSLTPSVNGLWDADRISQVVINLLSNAVKYGEGRTVDLVVSDRDQMAVLEVKDKGLGIAEKDQCRIFDRFERIHNSKSIVGLGLGLYIANQIVKAHGRSLRVESQLGQGSNFIVELPRTHQGLH